MTVAERINPFHDLYLTEAIGPDRFVKLFSPKFVQHATVLFQPGNVILKGLQGSGKSMLLNLLRPEIRIAYHQSDADFPIPNELGKFIGAGINLRKSGVLDFGQLILPNIDRNSLNKLAIHFGDFLNYWVIADLLDTIDQFINSQDSELLKKIGIHNNKALLDKFAENISKDSCWFGYLDNIHTISNLKKRIRDRIVIYRKYVNLNLENDRLPDAIIESKTVIGDPIARVAQSLRDAGVLDKDTKVFIRIDQYEQLPALNIGEIKFGNLCREVIHKALASRDSRVSYRIGTREYAWSDSPRIHGTNDVLEYKRDFSIVDIDKKLRRKENPRTWIFPEFAIDIFRLRLLQTPYANSLKRYGNDLIEQVFDRSLPPEDRAERYARTESARITALQLDKNTPNQWKVFLEKLAKKNPLSAKFATAWAKQKGSRKKNIVESPPSGDVYPWDEKPYWKKERSEQALLQIASANRQQLVWAGKDDVIGLSGGNILVFLFLCQHIWDAWIRDTRREVYAYDALPSISQEVQSQGILEASEEWLRKQLEGEIATIRRHFLMTIGKHFYKSLTSDSAMSYPGKNGFSLSQEDLEKSETVFQFLSICSSYGDLYESPHASKQKGQKRIKYYLAPIFSPYFKIPYRHTKEPEYVSTKIIQSWITDTNTKSKGELKEAQTNTRQLDMFGLKKE